MVHRQRGMTMQVKDPTGSSTTTGEPAKGPGLWKHIQAWDGKLSVAKGLTAVTLLTGFLGGYFQYLGAYEDKVSEQAKTDMAAATQTFLDITNAFAEAQMLQQLIYFDYAATLGEPDPGNGKMVTQAGYETFPAYTKARNGLRQNTTIFARKAEIYIDWASNLSRDPATEQVSDEDPLTETLLGNYNFDCDAHFPHFGNEQPSKSRTGSSEDVCDSGGERDNPKASTVNLCAIGDDKKVDPRRPAIIINWNSAKHHVLTMHYCFEVAHREIAMRESLCTPSSSVCKHWKRVRVGNATRTTFPGHGRFDRLRRQVVGTDLMRCAGNNLHSRKDAGFDKAPYRVVCDA
jgi:hypothetical protein